jgi:TorA maturation chaperone TorD
VAEIYAAAGFYPQELEIDPHWRAGMPDHIGFEMAFVSALFHNLARAQEPDATPLLMMRDAFGREHISRWVPDYGRQLTQHAQTPLYQALGWLTMRVVDESLCNLLSPSASKE